MRLQPCQSATRGTLSQGLDHHRKLHEVPQTEFGTPLHCLRKEFVGPAHL